MQQSLAALVHEFRLLRLNCLYDDRIDNSVLSLASELKAALPSAISALAGLPWPIVLTLLLFFFGARPARDWIDTLNAWRNRDRLEVPGEAAPEILVQAPTDGESH